MLDAWTEFGAVTVSNTHVCLANSIKIAEQRKECICLVIAVPLKESGIMKVVKHTYILICSFSVGSSGSLHKLGVAGGRLYL